MSIKKFFQLLLPVSSQIHNLDVADEELDKVLVKKADLGEDGKVLVAQLPEEVVNVADPGVVTVAASRALAASDHGATLECTAAGLTLTVPIGLPDNFACVVIPNGTTSFASSGGALLNGATTTLTRAASSNPMVAIAKRASVANSFVVSGS